VPIYVEAHVLVAMLRKHAGLDPWADAPPTRGWTSYDVQCLRLSDIQTMARWTKGRRKLHYSSKLRWR
jgi:hypothetical protein